MTAPADELERAYRRLLRLLPAEYRAEREEEMIDVLLSVAEPHQRRPHPADAVNLWWAIGLVWWRLLLRWVRPRSAVLGVAAVLVVALGMAVLPARPGLPVEVGRSAGLPQRLAGPSDATGSVSDAPPGRAIALYQQGGGPVQDIVLSADRDAYRRLDLATAHRGGDEGGTPAPALLSPDGIRVAVGYHEGKRPDVSIQNLSSGAQVSLPVGGAAGEWGVGAVPMAWSGRGDRIAVVVTPAFDASGDGHLLGDLVVLDVRTSRVTRVVADADIAAVAFAPDGTELVVQERSGGALRIVGLDGTTRRELTLPPGTGLTGPAAWSPDGRLIAVARGNVGCPNQHGLITMSDWCLSERIEFLDATSTRRAVPAPVTAGGRRQLLGWSAPDSVVLLEDDGAGDPALVETRLGGATRRLSAVPTERGQHPVGALQLATDLLGDLHVRAPMAVDRGRWPLSWRLGAAVAVTALAWLGVSSTSRILRRRRGRHLVPTAMV